MARLRRALGDIDGALELIEEAVPLYDTDFSPPVRPVAAIRARVQLANGDFDAARRWIVDSGLTVDDELSYVHEYEHITLARVLIANRTAGELDDAIRLLDRLLAAAEAGSRTGIAIEVQILQATAYAARGDTAAAVAALENALLQAAPEGHIRLFLHAGPTVTALLRAVISRPDATPHAQRVLAAINDAASPHRLVGSDESRRMPRSGLVEPLSNRELDVLRLLRSELSGPEIARELHVSMNTLRTHTKSIYTKLGATSRREAIRHAAEYNL
jgi:LuxR family maltose regulon positive regulatory protein